MAVIQRRQTYKFSFKNILQQLLHLSLPIDCFHSRDHKLSNRRHAAILVDKRTESRFTVKMVFCMIVGCGSQSARDKHLHFARVPSVVTNQGEEAEKLSFERRLR